MTTTATTSPTEDDVFPDGWTELDTKAVDTVRVLAADAVQKVGNGHPGTAISLAPVAYLLFQKVMRHNPAEPHWPGRDRFVLSCGHSSISLYIQLYLGGWGLELEDLEALRTWGSKTPGHPEYGHTDGVEITTGPLGQGIGNAVGMAMAARRERGLLDPDAPEGESIFDHHVYCLASDGDIEEGISSEASSLAATQRLGNLTLIYDRNFISIEGHTDIALSEDTAARYAAYGWHVATVDWLEGGEYHENVKALLDAIEEGKKVTDRPTFIQLRTIIAWPSPTKQNTEGAHGSALGKDEVAALKKVLGFDPEQSFAVDDQVLSHTRELRDRGAAAQAEWQKGFDTWAETHADEKALYDRMTADELTPGWEEALPSLGRRPQGRRHPRRVGQRADRAGPEAARAVGRLGRPRRLEQHDPQGRAELPADRPAERGVQGRPVRPGAALRHPRARDGRHPQRDEGPRRDAALRRHLPDLLRLHARRGAAVGPDAGPRDLRLDPRLHRSGRGRPDPPADRARVVAPAHPGPGRRAPRRRERDRRLLGRDPAQQRPARRADPQPAEPADRAARHRRLRHHRGRGQGRVRAEGVRQRRRTTRP